MIFNILESGEYGLEADITRLAIPILRECWNPEGLALSFDPILPFLFCPVPVVVTKVNGIKISILIHS